MMDATERGLNKDITFQPGENSTTVDASTFFQKVVARISAQVFAGVSYADNEPLIDALATFALSVFKASIVQSIFPRPIADFITRRYMSVGKNIDVIMREVTPHVVDIKNKEDQFGEMQPTDFMHMMLHTPAADDHQHTPEEAAFWMKDIALASIHTTSIYLGLALHDLSDRPDIQELLRKEINETKANNDGRLTPAAVSQMTIMDSFFRESLRIGSDYVGFRHKVMKETVLQSGITLPEGSTIGLSVYDAHMDPELQEIGPNGIPLDEFDPCRFVGRKSKKSTAVGPDLLIFGVGFHSCPGRYFASVEIKYLLASIIDRYDISTTTKDGKRAPNRLALVSTSR
jgi:cytochrome P450